LGLSLFHCRSAALSAPSVVFYGASGYANAIADAIEFINPVPLATVVSYIDDFRGDEGLAIADAPVISFATWRETLVDVPVFVTVGDPDQRKELVGRVSRAGGRLSPSFLAAARVANDVVYGKGGIYVCSSIGPNCVVGDHVHILSLAAVGEGCTIGDFTTFCPSSTVWGKVVIEAGVFIGVGARVVNESDDVMTIGTGAYIGAGAVVTRSVLPGERLAGNPATDFRTLAQRRVQP